jgi:hypothetical protein
MEPNMKQIDFKDVDTIDFKCDYCAYELYAEGYLSNSKDLEIFRGLMHKVLFDKISFSVYTVVYDSPCDTDVVII